MWTKCGYIEDNRFTRCEITITDTIYGGINRCGMQLYKKRIPPFFAVGGKKVLIIGPDAQVFHFYGRIFFRISVQ